MLCLLLTLAPLCALGYVFDGNVTVSGLSAGGFVAVQYHVAFSREVSGAAIFAGGPFYCALANLGIAASACMVDPLLIDTDALVEAAKVYATAGDIDAVEGLRGDQVYLYSGTQDTVVHPGVVKKTQEFYSAFHANVTADFTVPSEHCQPTVDFGNDCGTLDTPYISKCNYDGAGAALAILRAPKALNPRGQYFPNNLRQIKQRKYFPIGMIDVPGMAETGFLYVPTACGKNETACSIHVTFHGCNQNYDAVGLQYVEHSGYVEWAESNNIIVLFPQSVKSDIPYNPQGCFDWWGYTDPLNYAVQSGVQMATVHNMVVALKDQTM